MHRALILAAMVAALACAGCAGDGPPLAAPPSTLLPATDLAPSQVTASTVASPGVVSPCDVDQLEFLASEETIIGIHNSGSVECEVDVFDSPNRDPLMEPSVWLRPGGDAELTVTSDDSLCEQPTTVTSVDLVVNGEPIVAPVSLPVTCGVTLTAIYTAD